MRYIKDLHEARQSGMYTCVKENVPRRQETESLMTI